MSVAYFWHKIKVEGNVTCTRKIKQWSYFIRLLILIEITFQTKQFFILCIRHHFISFPQKQRNCLFVHFLSTLVTLFFWAGMKCTAAQAPGFHPSERYARWFTPGLPQEMLTTWNKIRLLPRAINKQRYASLSHFKDEWKIFPSRSKNNYFIYGLQEGNEKSSA